MKKILSFLLVAAMIISIPVYAFADTFTDMDSSHWAYSYVKRAAEEGAVNGMGDGTFSPDSDVTYVQFITILTRAFCADELDLSSVDGTDTWYGNYLTTAISCGLLEGTDAEDAIENDSSAEISRYDMAYMIYNLVQYKGCEALSESDAETVISSVADSDAFPEDSFHRVALATVYSLGIITGVDDEGTFAGDDVMTRAQAAAVYCRISDYLNAEMYSESSLWIGGSEYSLGMSESELTALAGTPDAEEPSVYGWTWYIFGTETYEDFFMAGVSDGSVVALASAGESFTYMGLSAGSTGSVSNEYGGTFHDSNDGDIVHAVYIRISEGTTDFSDSNLLGEAQVNFHLTNAFRVYHGLEPLKWSSVATTAALNHAQDMASYNYFSHTSRDGTTFSQRLTNVGIVWTSASENICRGYSTGISAYNAWVNSSGHRENMLRDRTYIGIAFAYGSMMYGVQDYYS